MPWAHRASITVISLFLLITALLGAAQDLSQHGREHPPVQLIAERGQYSPLMQNNAGGLGRIKVSLQGLLAGFSYKMHTLVQCGERVFVDASEHVNVDDGSGHSSTISASLPELMPCRLNITVEDKHRELPAGEMLIAAFFVTIPFDRVEHSFSSPDNVVSAESQANDVAALHGNSELHGDNHPAVMIHFGRSPLTYTSRDEMRMELRFAV